MHSLALYLKGHSFDLIETFSRLRDGPIKLMFLEMATRILSTWVVVGESNSSTQSYSRTSISSSSGTKTQPTDGSLVSLVPSHSSLPIQGDGDSVSQWVKKALEEAESCRLKLAVEACLHRYGITRFWPDILTRATS